MTNETGTGSENVCIELVEQADSWYFSVDSGERTEHHYKKRTGFLQRKFNRLQTSKAIELNSTTDAKPLMATNRPPAILKIPGNDIVFSPSKILQENQYVLDTLDVLKLSEWKVIFRAQRTARVIIPGLAKEKKSDFTYFSILIKMKLPGRRQFIELGEGAVHALKFNQNGLCSRIRKIVENHRDSRVVNFTAPVPVILNAGDGAILFHEILGHSLEADYIYQGVSPISPGQLGKQIVSPNVTLVTRDPNDSFFKNIQCDDEGETPGPETLVENGVLRHLISDNFHKKRMNLGTAGHARQEDFTRPPMPRMFAIYLKPGPYYPEDLISSTNYGVFAESFGDGKVYFHKDEFFFNIREAWLIKDGLLSTPLGSVVVRGSIRDTLNSVDMVANDFRFDKGISYCYKNGQTVNVRVGQPTVKIKNLTIARERGE